MLQRFLREKREKGIGYKENREEPGILERKAREWNREYGGKREGRFPLGVNPLCREESNP